MSASVQFLEPHGAFQKMLNMILGCAGCYVTAAFNKWSLCCDSSTSCVFKRLSICLTFVRVSALLEAFEFVGLFECCCFSILFGVVRAHDEA